MQRLRSRRRRWVSSKAAHPDGLVWNPELAREATPSREGCQWGEALLCGELNE